MMHDPFEPFRAPWGYDLCDRLATVDHPDVAKLIARPDIEGGGLGTVLLGDLGALVVRLADSPRTPQNEAAVDRVISILDEWLDLTNPHMINDFLVGFIESLEGRGDTGRRLIERLPERLRTASLPEGFPWTFPSVDVYAAKYRPRSKD